VYKVGQNVPSFGRTLNGLFKQAITAGKRVRAETSISTGSVSVSSAAVELAQLKLPTHNFADAKVCIIGAGKMSTLLVKHLLSKGCREVTVLNRSLPRAQALAEEYPDMKFNIHLMGDLMACVENSDVVFAASGSEELLLHKADIEPLPARPEVVGGVRRFIDISVPRNIAPAINELTGAAIVYNVDDLKEVVAGNKEARAQVGWPSMTCYCWSGCDSGVITGCQCPTHHTVCQPRLCHTHTHTRMHTCRLLLRRRC
jgi:glutamyl-tRNA reductase